MAAIDRSEAPEAHRRQSQEAGWSLGWASAVDSQGRTLWIVERIAATESVSLCVADEVLTAFVELERAIYDFAVDSIFYNFTTL